jgi:hypothetical protein
MRVIQKDAVQAHAVPRRVLEARGPFPTPYQPQVVELTHDPDKFPPGATAQNGMQEVALFECQTCFTVLKEDQLDGHVCEGDN